MVEEGFISLSLSLLVSHLQNCFDVKSPTTRTEEKGFDSVTELYSFQSSYSVMAGYLEGYKVLLWFW